MIEAFEGRVEHSYQRVVARARELRQSLALPDTLDARLYTLGRAESELHYVEPPGACQCWPRCNREEHERKLSATRRAAESRLRIAGFLRDVA